MTDTPIIDTQVLREQVREKYRAVAVDPDATYHFHTGRSLADRLGYDPTIVDTLPDRAVESFAGVANPFSLRTIAPGERVVDIGSGAGFDSFVAAHHVGPAGDVVGVDMTAEMLAKATATAELLELSHVDVPVRVRRGPPGRRRLGRRRDLQRCDQPVRRQARRVRRDPPRAAPGRGAAVRRHRQRPPGANRGDARRRPVDRLNRRRAAP